LPVIFIALVMAEVHYMTADGLEKLKKELSDALAQRPVISAAIAEAREKGDLSENAEYDAAREAQGLLEVKIAKLKNLVANAKVIDESQIGTEKVQIMNRVKVENLSLKRVMEFTIVGETEADFSKGKLASTTPIAQALLGHKVGETVDAKVPSGIMKFKILEISL
jgi:transcription elongation factor GreA